MRIPDNHKFSCIPISFSPRITRPCREGVVDLGNGSFICLQRPFEWEDRWIRWIGEVQVEAANDSNCFLLATAASARSEVLDQENHDLGARVQHLLWALLLHGIPAYQHGVQIISGGTPNGETQIRQVSPIQQFLHPRLPAAWALDATMIESVRTVLDGIVAIAADEERFNRLKRCLNAWSIAAQQRKPGERVHNFVRVLDGILLASKAQTLARRVRVHLNPEDLSDDDVRAMFELRNHACHLGEWKHAVTSRAGDLNPAALADRLTLRCEQLAGEALVRTLGDADLRQVYESESSAREFAKGLDALA